MSYDDAQCPCGGRKDPGTMLCPACVAYLTDDYDYGKFLDLTLPANVRREHAIRSIRKIRGRRRAGREVAHA